MVIFPNRIDKNYRKNLEDNIGVIKLPDYFYKRKYVEVYKKYSLNLKDIWEVEGVSEKKLIHFLEYCNKIQAPFPTFMIPYFSDEVWELLKRGYSFDFATSSFEPSFKKNITFLENFFSVSFIEENYDEIKPLLEKERGLSFLENKKVLREDKEQLISWNNDNLLSYLDYFDPKFIIENADFIELLYTSRERPYFHRLKEIISTISEKTEFIENFDFIQHNFKNPLNDFVMGVYLDDIQCFPYLKTLVTKPRYYLPVDLNDEVFLQELVIRSNIPFYRKFALQYFDIFPYKKAGILGVFSFDEESFQKVLNLYSNLSEEKKLSLNCYKDIIDFLFRFRQASLDEDYKILFQEIIEKRFSFSSFFNALYDKTVIQDLRENILNVNRKEDLLKWPTQTILYENVPIEIITIDDYPFNLLVSGIEVKHPLGMGLGTYELSKQIINHPEMWMDMNVVGNDRISMTRICESAFDSWGDHENAVICGFSDIRPNQIVDYHRSDANTSMDIKNIQSSDELKKELIYLSAFYQRKYKTFFASGFNDSYEEIRANRYLYDETGSLQKYAPDYMVVKSLNIPNLTFQWAKMYGQKIVRFDREKIARKAASQFLNTLKELELNPSSFDDSVQEYLNYLHRILCYFASTNVLLELRDKYFQVLEQLICVHHIDCEKILNLNLQDDERFKQLLELNHHNIEPHENISLGSD